MSLTREEIAGLAALCRIALSEQEIESLQGDLSVILDHVRMLEEVDTSDAPPTSHSADIHSVMREDVAVDSMAADDALANAPRRRGDYFRVNAALEE